MKKELNDKGDKKEYLKKKFIEFQYKLSDLTHAFVKQEKKYKSNEKKLLLELFEVLDTFDIFFENMKEKESSQEKSTKKILKNVQSINNKLVRLLKGRDIYKIELPDNKARQGLCKIIDTQERPELKNETVISTVKAGYINRKENKVIRTAEVITVNNPTK